MAITVHANGLVITEHEFSVPLDHARADGPRITVFAREVSDPDGTDRPFLVFFQGGPGMEASRPTRKPTSPSWLDRALQDFRVLLLDQRGTGRSTPVGTLPGMHARRAGRLPHTFPRGLDRSRCGGDSPRARRRTLERPRPELRRLLCDDLPVARARGAARGIDHGRAAADRPAYRRGLRGDLPPRPRPQPRRTTSATPRTGARAQASPATRGRGRAAFPPATG